jgi:hypothetical protein
MNCGLENKSIVKIEYEHDVDGKQQDNVSVEFNHRNCN